MRNKFEGNCFRCKKTVAIGAGYPTRRNGRWDVQHESCAREAKKAKSTPCTCAAKYCSC